MKIFDISLPLSTHLPAYPGDPPFVMEPVAKLSRGDGANLSRLSLSSHAGTHIDPPSHMLEGGNSVDQIPLPLLVGDALVGEFHGVQELGRRELSQLNLNGVQRLLLKTDNSALWGRQLFSPEFTCLTADGARYLVESGIRLVGIDYVSVEPLTGDGEVHRVLLDYGVVIIEGLNLSGVPPGMHHLVCLPLRITGGDGAPARAILMPSQSEDWQQQQLLEAHA